MGFQAFGLKALKLLGLGMLLDIGILGWGSSSSRPTEYRVLNNLQYSPVAAAVPRTLMPDLVM